MRSHHARHAPQQTQWKRKTDFQRRWHPPRAQAADVRVPEFRCLAKLRGHARLRARVMVPFTKASACGNDFLIIDGLHAPADLYEFSRRICDRHNGVGADGVEWLFPAPDADIRVRLINADGSE